MKKSLMVVAAFAVLGGLFLVSPSWSQPPQGGTGTSSSPIRAVPSPNTVLYDEWLGQQPAIRSYPGAPAIRSYPGASTRAEIAKLMNDLRDAEDDAKKADITKQLQVAVDKYFDEDMKARETELTKLGERLIKLRSQLDRRRKAKDEIIKLQLKVMVNEAEGLGFSGTSLFNTDFFPNMTGSGAVMSRPVASPTGGGGSLVPSGGDTGTGPGGGAAGGGGGSLVPSGGDTGAGPGGAAGEPIRRTRP